MTDTQLYLSIGIPMLFNAALIGLLVAYINARFDGVTQEVKGLHEDIHEIREDIGERDLQRWPHPRGGDRRVQRFGEPGSNRDFWICARGPGGFRSHPAGLRAPNRQRIQPGPGSDYHQSRC
jgi:hypothetical protein